MAYQTAAPASTANLIADLIDFAVSYGGFTLGNTWTFQTDSGFTGNSAGATHNWTARALSRDGQFVMLAWPTTAPNKVTLNSCTSSPTSGRLTSQTGASTENCGIELGTAPLRYHMFSDGFGVNCVVEWVGGAFQHINFGYMQKYGAFTGGIYVTGSPNNRQISAGSNYYGITSSFNGRPFDWLSSSSYSVANPGHLRASYGGNTFHSFGADGLPGGYASNLYMRGNGSNSWMFARSPNTYNCRSILIPVELIIAESDVNAPATWLPVGRVNNAAFINLTNLTPGDLVLTDWMVFPISAKNAGGTVGTYINSLNYGMAYKK